MGEVVPFPKKKKMVPLQKLTTKERNGVLSILRDKGLANYIGILDGGRYICVFDSEGESYFIGREEYAWYLFAPDDTMIAAGPHIDDVLNALEATLSSHAGLPA